MSSRFAPLLGGLGLVVAVAGCGGSGSEGAFRPAGDVNTRSTTAMPSQAGRPGPVDTPALTPVIIAQYKRFQKVYETSFAMNDTSELAGVATEPILGQLLRTAQRARSQGIFWRYHNVLNPKLASITEDGRQAVVLDCVQTLGTFKYDARTGRRLTANETVGQTRYRALMRLVGGTWKLSDSRSEVRKC
ncbi:hypothetical protein [Actinomadura sp. HBU206391]|uniref:hypothetical protein n=1 Tax=Actinomadura sp. HBU206391 TaxID=2731692 RepID=UPI00164FDECE|nr:hypothetical protein [Actinomadura sp. HBU206391]MBC6457794.1 hypothetical protein [Actinomadura sp. HBU206391]